MMWIAAGEFLMAATTARAEERAPGAQGLRVAGFWMDRTHVTNAQFAAFVKATGYSPASRKPDCANDQLQSLPGRRSRQTRRSCPRDGVVGTQRPVPLNDYAQCASSFPRGLEAPARPPEQLEGKDDHPAVQVS